MGVSLTCRWNLNIFNYLKMRATNFLYKSQRECLEPVSNPFQFEPIFNGVESGRDVMCVTYFVILF